MKNINTLKMAATVTLLFVTMLFLIGCSDAHVASRNLSKQGDMFQLNRRVIFYNGITGEYMLAIEGRLSIHHGMDQLEVTCLTAPGQFKKHFLGLSDNVTYFCEQLDSSEVDVYHYKVLFKPSAIVPKIDMIN